MPKINKKTVDFFNRYGKNPKLESNKLAYLAGLLDGEGNIKVEKWGSIRLRIGMTDKRTIKWIHKNFDGVYMKPYKLKSGKIYYNWYSTDVGETLKLMIMLYPFLITKQFTVLKALKNLITRLKNTKKFSVLKQFNPHLLKIKK